MSAPGRTLPRAAVVLGLVVGALAVYYSFHAFYDETRGKRRAGARTRGAPIGIAVVWPAAEGIVTIERGVRLAVEEINAAGGVKLVAPDGKPDPRLIAVRFFEEGGTADLADVRGFWEEPFKTRRVRMKIAHDPGVAAVIGHFSAPETRLAAITYEKNGILLFQPYPTASDLTAHRFANVFRTIPSDKEFAAALVRAAVARGLPRIGILSARNDLGSTLAREIERQIGHTAVQCGGNETRASLAFQISYPLETTDFRPLAERIAQKYPPGSFDCIVLTDRLPRVGVLMRHLRGFGIDKPILGGPTLDTPLIWQAASEAANGVRVVSTFAAAETPTPMAAELSSRCRALYGEPPTLRVAQGYEAVKLLAQAIERGGSAEPELVATSLRSGGAYQGLSGPVEFDDSGAIEGKSIFMKEMRRGLFRIDPEPAPSPGCRIVTESGETASGPTEE